MPLVRFDFRFSRLTHLLRMKMEKRGLTNTRYCGIYQKGIKMFHSIFPYKGLIIVQQLNKNDCDEITL